MTTMTWPVRLIYLLVLVAGGWSVTQYEGDKAIFCFFTAIVFAIGYLAIRPGSQYAHLFLGIFWFIGFWVKYEFHLITGEHYYELYGLFDDSIDSWNAVFLVLAVGGAGYLAGRLISLPVITPLTTSLLTRPIIVPSWWPSYRNAVWLGAALLVVATVAANRELGLFVRGFVANVVLPWPLGGFFAWMTDIGLALLLSLLLVWDRQSRFGIARGFAALCIEGALFSISTLSRGVYFFHTVPPLVTESADAVKRADRRPLAVMFAIWVLVGIAIPSASTFLRFFGENTVPITEAEWKASETATISRSVRASKTADGRTVSGQTASGLWAQFLTMSRLLVIDRWTGLEGMMATVAYPAKSMDLFVEAAVQRRSYGTVDVFTKKISGSTFTEENARKFHFATLSGPMAFLYFSGSLTVVFLGMFLIAILMSAIELLWSWLARDRLLLAMSGLYLALIVMQLSGGVVQAGTGLVAVTIVHATIWFIGHVMQSRRTDMIASQQQESSCSGA